MQGSRFGRSERTAAPHPASTLLRSCRYDPLVTARDTGLRLKLVGQLIIPVPASLPQADHEFASQLGGSVHALHDGRDEAVASQLQRIIVGADTAEQVDHSRSVTTVYRRPQGGALLL